MLYFHRAIWIPLCTLYPSEGLAKLVQYHTVWLLERQNSPCAILHNITHDCHITSQNQPTLLIIGGELVC